MTTRPVRHRPRAVAVASSLLGLLLALPALAVRDDAHKGASKPPEAAAAASIEAPKPAPKPERTESLRKPSGETRPNPEQTNPALLNPCHGSPQPKWCGE